MFEKIQITPHNILASGLGFFTLVAFAWIIYLFFFNGPKD
jgi:preprotein translocase subunit Sec61beta